MRNGGRRSVHPRSAQASGGLQAPVQRRLRQRGEQTDHRHLHPGGGDEPALALEGIDRVVVETDDEAGEDLQPGGVDPAHRLEQIAAHVLRLAGLAQARLVRRFDADEHPGEVRRAQQRQQLRVAGHVDRGLGSEAEAPAVPALVPGQVAQQRLGALLVPDQVVVDEEHVVHAERAQPIQLAADLLRCLGTRPAPEHDDDVAELAVVRAAARELQADVGVTLEAQQIEARHRRIGQIHGAALPVQGLRAAGLEVAAELRPLVLGLAGDHGIGVPGERLRAQRGITAAGDHVTAARTVPGEQFALARQLHAHAAHADHVGPRIERHPLDVLVDDAHLPLRRTQRRERGQAERRVQGPLAAQHALQRPAEAPEALREARIDEQQAHAPRRLPVRRCWCHVIIPAPAKRRSRAHLGLRAARVN